MPTEQYYSKVPTLSATKEIVCVSPALSVRVATLNSSIFKSRVPLTFFTVISTVSPLLTVIVKGVKEKGAASTLNSFTTRVSSTSLPGTGIVVSTFTPGSKSSTGATPLFWNKKKPPSTKTTTTATVTNVLFILF